VRLPQHPTVRDYTATREEAMAAFKRAWRGERAHAVLAHVAEVHGSVVFGILAVVS
jgi:hypothetical protein